MKIPVIYPLQFADDLILSRFYQGIRNFSCLRKCQRYKYQANSLFQEIQKYQEIFSKKA